MENILHFWLSRRVSLCFVSFFLLHCVTNKRYTTLQQKLSWLFRGRQKACQEMCLLLTGLCFSLFTSETDRVYWNVRRVLYSEVEQSVPGVNAEEESHIYIFLMFSFQAKMVQHCISSCFIFMYVHPAHSSAVGQLTVRQQRSGIYDR